MIRRASVMGKKNKSKNKDKKLKLIDFTRKERAVSIIEYLLLAGLLVTSFIIFFYTDYSDTLDNSIMLGDCILSGKLSDFYEYAATHSQKLTVYSANYDLFIYIVFLIWNLPVFIAHRIKEFDYMNTLWALLWCKALIAGFTIASAELVRRISGVLGANRKTGRLAALIFTASTITVIPAFVTGQYDIISIFLMLLGLMFYFKGGKSMKWFYLVFALAVPMKTFAIFIYIPLILYREKNILKIALKMIPAFSLNFVSRLIFLGNDAYKMALDPQNRDAVKVITDSTIEIGKFQINLFIIVYLAILVFCYKAKDDGSKYKPVYISAVSMASFLTLVNVRSYWLILMAPFIVLILFADSSRIRLNVLIYTIGTACGTVYYLMSHWVLSYKHMTDHLVLKSYFESMPDTKEPVYTGGVKEFFLSHDLSRYAPVLYALFIGSVILLLILNRPSERKENCSEYSPEWWMGLLQICITSAIVGLLIFVGVRFRYVPAVSYDVVQDYVGGSLLKGMSVEQDFTAARNQDVSEIIFQVMNENDNRSVRNSINVALTEKVSGKQLAFATVNAALVPDQTPYTMKIGKVHLEKGHTYTVSISATVRNDYDTRIAVGLVPIGENKPAARLGGVSEMDMAVAMTVR